MATTTTTRRRIRRGVHLVIVVVVVVVVSIARDGNRRRGGVGDCGASAAAAAAAVAQLPVASRTIRARLLLHLSVFGTLCLAGQSLGYRLSTAAPFLGLSAAGVNVHNVLACASALTKKR